MTPLRDTAHAKINLFLHVTGRRNDGYHLLDSLAVFAEAADHLTLEGAYTTDEQNVTLCIDGRFAPGLTAGHDNLILRAAHDLSAILKKRGQTCPAARIHLLKELPVASGIGGGSADAACALRLLGRYWNVEQSLLEDIAPQLGADVPVCLHQKAARMEGIGEKLTSSPSLPPVGMMLVNPGISVSTPAVFRHLAESGAIRSRPVLSLPEKGWSTPEDLADFLRTTTNDLQAAAVAQVPAIQTVLDRLSALPGALLTRMSGSGATCFALFHNVETAQQAQAQLAAENNTQAWWHWAGRA